MMKKQNCFYANVLGNTVIKVIISLTLNYTVIYLTP